MQFMKGKLVLIILAISTLLPSCDIYKPQKKFRLAVPEKDYFYNYMASHLKPFLERNGYQIELVNAPTTIEANRMVARGEADLCFINNHSVPLTQLMGAETGKLRSVLPLTTRLLFVFSKVQMPDTATAKELFENKKIGVELLNGEAQLNFERFISRAQIKGTQLVTFNDNPDVIVFWGTFYGTRVAKYLADGWHPFSFKENWIEFLTLNDPALKPYTLPSIPGESRSIRIHTIATETVLAINKEIGENAVFELAKAIYQNKLELMREDIMYGTITESFDKESLLFPIHEGTVSFLKRDQPTFFERYADAIALVITMTALLYGSIQTISNKIAKRKKDQVDKYFLEFLEIRSNKEVKIEEKVKILDNLFQRAVEQMTSEKLEKSDFHIISRLIQQELTILKFNG